MERRRYVDGNMRKAFSTLYIVIVLGAVSLGSALALSLGTVWSIRSGSASTRSVRAKALANGCAEAALEAIRSNNAFSGAADLAIGGAACRYAVTISGPSTRSVSASSTVSGVTRKVRVDTASFEPLTVVSWQEVP